MLNIKVLNTSEYKEIYYLYLISRLKEAFYQKNGFVVLPSAKTKTSGEVVFPYKEELVQSKKEIDKFLGKVGNKHDIFLLSDIKIYKNISPFKTKLFKSQENIKPILNFFNSNKKTIKKILEFLMPEYISWKINIEIIPVDFGTVCTFNGRKDDKKKTITLRFTYRYDLDIQYLMEGFISSIVILKLDENANSEKNSIYWEKREFLVDYLVYKTLVSNLIKTKSIYQGTLEGIKKIKQKGALIKESNDYLKKLGFVYATKLEVSKESVKVNNFKVNLTISEEKILELMYAKRGDVVTFDEIGNKLWEANPDKFSYYAISRTVSDIRRKFKDAGVLNDLIYTARGKGLILKV